MIDAIAPAPLPQLQPLSVGELLDRAIQVYRKNFLTLVGIIAVVQIPVVVLQIIVSIVWVQPTLTQLQFNPNPQDPLSVFSPEYLLGQLGLVGVGILAFLLGSIAWAAGTRVAAEHYLYNKRLSFTEAYAQVGRSLTRLGFTILMILAVGLGLLIWSVGVPCLGQLTGLGLIIYGSVVIYPLVIACSTLENRTGAASFRRAWDLARRRFWWVLGFMFVLGMFSLVFAAGPATVVSLVLILVLNANFLADNPQAVIALQTIVQSITSVATSILYWPLTVISTTLMYFDLRVRTEGFDLALSAAGADAASSAEAVAQAPRPEQTRPMTAAELGYFVILSLLVLLPIIIVYVCLFSAMLAALLSAVSSARPY